MTRIALLDYGMGNLHSAAKALEHVGATVDVTNDPKLIAQADKIVFPGVGAMRDCMQGMHEAGIDDVVRHAVFNKPVLAICVGMQALMQHSEENGGADALGIFEGEVKRFPDVAGLKVPHMGWNSLEFLKEDKILKYINAGEYVYYVHSYYAENCNDSVIACSDYDIKIPGIVKNNNIYGIQFHPEKSGKTGLNILKAFGEMI